MRLEGWAAEDAGRPQDVAFAAGMRLAVPSRTLVALPVTGGDHTSPTVLLSWEPYKEGPPAVIGGPFGVS